MFKVPTLLQQLEKIRLAFEWASGCMVCWNALTKQGRYRDDEPYCILAMSRFAPNGTIEVRFEDPDTGELQEILCANRHLEISAEFKSRSQELDSCAMYAASRAQIRLESPFVNRTFFTKNNISISNLEPAIQLPGEEIDNREENRAELLINLNIALNEADENMVVSTIQKTDITSDLKKEDSTSLDAALQWTDERIQN